jgi:hypothetical protein
MEFSDVNTTKVTLSELNTSELSKKFTLSEDITKGSVVQLLSNGNIEKVRELQENIPTSTFKVSTNTNNYEWNDRVSKLNRNVVLGLLRKFRSLFLATMKDCWP